MSKIIRWSAISKVELEDIFQYLILNWNFKTADKFRGKILVEIERIAKNPENFLIINHNYGIRKCVVTRQNTIFFREFKDHIQILHIFDTRQHPDKLKWDL